MLSPLTGNKFYHTTSIQKYSRGPSQCNKARNKSLKYTDKKEVIFSLSEDGLFIYIEKHMESIKNF